MDRNIASRQLPAPKPPSLSARRAWIEMLYQLYDTYAKVVALRKESVDRNKHTQPAEQVKAVALRKESVDRNHRPDL